MPYRISITAVALPQLRSLSARDQRMVSIQPLDADDEADSLVNELLESNEQFRALVRKSIESARRSFAAEGDDAVHKPDVPEIDSEPRD